MYTHYRDCKLVIYFSIVDKRWEIYSVSKEDVKLLNRAKTIKQLFSVLK